MAKHKVKKADKYELFKAFIKNEYTTHSVYSSFYEPKNPYQMLVTYVNTLTYEKIIKKMEELERNERLGLTTVEGSRNIWS